MSEHWARIRKANRIQGVCGTYQRTDTQTDEHQSADEAEGELFGHQWGMVSCHELDKMFSCPMFQGVTGTRAQHQCTRLPGCWLSTLQAI